MPFDGSGNYTPAAAPAFPAVGGAVISSTYYNTVINDVATALNNVLTRDGQGKPTAAISWNGQNLSGVAALTSTSLITGTGVFSGVVTVPDAAYGAGWSTSLQVPTKNALYNKFVAVTAEIAAAVTGLLELKGDLNCAANPNYPVGLTGDSYYVTAAGRVGGAAGKVVDIGDVIVAKADNAGGTEAAVGTSWFVLEHNVVGALMASNNLSDVASVSAARTNLSAAASGVNSDITSLTGLTTALSVGQGGTGGNTQALGRTGLGLGNTATFNEAVAADYRANTASRDVSVTTIWLAGAVVTLTDAVTVVVDMNTFINAKVTLAGNRTLGTPSNAKEGQSGFIRIIQDATGTRTLAYAANWKFPGAVAPVLTTTAGATDLLYYTVLSSTEIHGSLVKDVR